MHWIGTLLMLDDEGSTDRSSHDGQTSCTRDDYTGFCEGVPGLQGGCFAHGSRPGAPARAAGSGTSSRQACLFSLLSIAMLKCAAAAAAADMLSRAMARAGERNAASYQRVARESIAALRDGSCAAHMGQAESMVSQNADQVYKLRARPWL